jgi:hypothetical protein
MRSSRRVAASGAEVHADAIDHRWDRFSFDKTHTRMHDFSGRYHDTELSSGD